MAYNKKYAVKLLSGTLLICAALLGASCNRAVNEQAGPAAADSKAAESTAPYLTQDNRGNAVLCWTAKDPADSVYRLKYAVFNEKTGRFSAAVTVPASAGTSVSAESMNKIAFKADGTIIAVFARKFEKQKNPYAGAIYYTTSVDGGKSWSAAQFLHSDTSHAYGRSFFDLARLDDGEVAAIWLDGRFGEKIKGSALFFARTEKGSGFGRDTCLSKNTCECCRTALLSGADGNLHIAFRAVSYPPAMMGRQVRDMVYLFSVDKGRTFSTVKPLSHDNWEISGCPHTGPALALSGSKVNAVWFTASGEPGLYYTASAAAGKGFTGRTMLSPAGRHPQLLTLPGSTKLAMVCEEDTAAPQQAAMQMTGNEHGAMAHGHTEAATNARIVLRVFDGAKVLSTLDITGGSHPDHHAVLTAAGKGLLLAWVREFKGRPVVYYKKLAAVKI